MNWLELLIHNHYGTKDHFAQKMGVSRWTVYRWIKQPAKMPVEYLLRIQSFANVDLNAISFNNATEVRC